MNLLKIFQLDLLSDKVNELSVSTKVSLEPPKETPSLPPSIGVLPPVNAVAVKSDHLKLTFPTFGRPSDDSDPLLYLTKCKDFLYLILKF